MALSTGKTYYLVNRNSGRALNVYAGDISKNSNVVQWKFTEGDKDQQWKLESTSGGYVLQTIHSSSHVLDAYLPKSTGANADVWPKDGSGAQKLSLHHVDGDYYRLKLPQYNIYLTAIGTGNSQGGYTRTSEGNVYWLPNKGDSDESQQWEFIDIYGEEKKKYDTSSNHSLSNGATYQLTSVSADGYSMNLYNSDTSSNSNVVLWETNIKDKDQQWIFTKSSGDVYILKYKPNPKYALDAFKPNEKGANADVWETGGEYLRDQEFYINKTGSHYKINLKRFPNLYLTAVGNSHGSASGYGENSVGNIRWKEYTGDANQKWDLTLVPEITYPQKSEHRLSENSTYMLTSASAPKHSMNLYNGDTSSNSNIVLWETNTKDKDQQWIFSKSSGSSYILKYKPDPKYALDAYMPKVTGANTDVWETGGEYLKDQEFYINEVGGYYEINLKRFPNLFLTAVGNANGTAGGYGENSVGNIRWKERTEDNTQRWKFTLVPEIIYPHKSEHHLSENSTYMLTSASAPKHSMNLYNGDTSSNSNVVLWETNSRDRDQQWIFTKSSGDTYILKYKPDPKYALDAYKPKETGANADVWETGGEYLKDQEFFINEKNGYYEINLKQFPNLFLTAVGNDNGTASGYGENSAGNIRWKERTEDNTQKWKFTEVVEKIHPTKSKHNLKIGEVYQFSPLNAPKRNMNLYAGNTSANSNVVLYDGKESDSQQYWIVDNSTNSTNVLRYAPNKTYVLDAYKPKDSGANADVWTYGGAYLKDQEVCITEIATNQYTINLASRPHLYLTAVSDDNGELDGYYSNSNGNIYWAPDSGTGNQIWKVNYIGDWKPSTPPDNPTDTTKEGILGIDVSTHQKDIDWTQVSGPKFVIVRAGYFTDSGNTYDLKVDNYFHTNMEGAIAAGIPIGIYVYSYLENLANVDGATQKLLDLISPYKKDIKYPVAFDIEDSDEVKYSSKSKSFNTSLTERFCENIKNAGYKPMWYANKNFAENFIDAKRLTDKGYDFWVANFTSNPYKGDYKIWQFTNANDNRIKGIDGTLDVNYSYYDYVLDKPVETGGNNEPETPGGKMSLEEFAIHIIRRKESDTAGKYGATNPKAFSIGIIQWYGTRAYGLLLNIKNAGGDTSVLPSNIIEDLNKNNPKLYENRNFISDDERKAVSTFISSEIGRKEQDNLAKKDMNDYITHFENYGVKFGDTLAFLCEYYNETPAGVDTLLGKTADYRLDNVYKLAENQSSSPKRRKEQYEYVKANYDAMCTYGNKSPDGQSGGEENPNDKNYATYPCKSMNITNGYRDNNHASYGDYPFDDGCDDSGRSYMYCPCDEMKVVRIRGMEPNNGVNTIWLESTSNVIMPCGTDLMTMMVMHPNDDDFNYIPVGKVFKRGQAMFREGNDGVKDNHFHISMGRGSIIGNGWYNNDGIEAWSLQTTGGVIKAEEAFYLDPSFTTIRNSNKIKFTLLPK